MTSREYCDSATFSGLENWYRSPPTASAEAALV